MNDLQSKAADVANELMGRYAYLIQGVNGHIDPDNLRLLLQYAFFEGRADGIEAMGKAQKEVVARVFGGNK